MTVVKIPLIPIALYRIRSAGRKNPDLYLEWQKGGGVRAVPLKNSDSRQEWNLMYEADGTYGIFNRGSNESLSVKVYNDKGTPRYTLSSGGRQFWVFNACGDDEFILLNPKNGLCVDLGEDNSVNLWERLDVPNQRWILESVGPLQPQAPTDPQPTDPNNAPGVTAVKGGNYTIVNPTMNTELWPYADSDTFVHVMVNTQNANPLAKGRFWTVSPLAGDSYFVFSSEYHRNEKTPGYLWLASTPYMHCSKTPTTCRLIPVPGKPGFFHIALQSGAQVIFSNSERAGIKFATLNIADESQFWQFIPA